MPYPDRANQTAGEARIPTLTGHSAFYRAGFVMKNSPKDTQTRITSAIAGGWVADAASLGLHWLYESNRILEVAGQAPEFLTPRADYFGKGFGFFAHGGIQAGDVSHYGAATKVLSDSLLACKSELSVRITSDGSWLNSARAMTGGGPHRQPHPPHPAKPCCQRQEGDRGG